MAMVTLEVEFADGRRGSFPMSWLPDAVAVDRGWRGGLFLAVPLPAEWPVSNDFFDAAVNEGGLADGSCEGEDWSLGWRLVRHPR